MFPKRREEWEGPKNENDQPLVEECLRAIFVSKLSVLRVMLLHLTAKAGVCKKVFKHFFLLIHVA